MRSIIIPENRRIAISDSVLRDLGEKTGAKFKRGKEGQLEIEGEGGSEWFAELVINAMTLGFDYKKASKLLNDEFFLDVVDLNAAMWGKKKRVEQMKGRIIGTEGKARSTIEFLSDCWIAVGEDKVGLIGKYEDLKIAKEAVFKLLEGKTHGTVYAFLEKKKAEK